MGSEWLYAPLEEIANIATGKLDSNASSEGGFFPFFTCSPETLRIDNYAFNCEAVLLAGNNANGVFSVKYYNGKFNAYQRTYVISSKDDSILDVKFLYYQLTRLTDLLREYSIGTATKFLTLKILAPLSIPLPSLPEQRAIAHILGTLDDKIELNRRMNETLEAMARALFKAWFVDFEPVRAKLEGRWRSGQSLPGLPAHLYDLFPDRLVDSELGEIPEGWEVSKFGSVATCLDKYRIPLSSKQRQKRKGDIPYYGATSIMDYVDEFIFDGIYLLIGEDGSVVKEDGTPYVQYIWGKSWVNNHAHVLQGANGICIEQLMLFIASQNIAAHVTGAVQLKLNQQNMNSIPFIKASAETNLRFAALIAPLYEHYRHLTEQSRNLAQLRDTLLPKLTSGDLRLQDAERFVGTAI